MFANERDAPPVAEQPVVQVESWRVIEAANGDLHLLAILGHGPLRITSPIASFDAAAAALTTQSGRKYELLGPPEARQLQITLMAANAVRAGLVNAIDISDVLWESVAKQ